MTTEPTPLTAEEVEAMRAEMQQDEFWEDDILTRRLLATLDAARSRETALREALVRIVVTALSLILGGVVGLALSGTVRVADGAIANGGLLMFLGALIAFLFGFFFISPIRLWRRAVLRIGELERESETKGHAPKRMKLTKTSNETTLEIEGERSEIDGDFVARIVGGDQSVRRDLLRLPEGQAPREAWSRREFLSTPMNDLRAALAQPEEKRPGYCVVHPGLPLHRHSDSPSGPAYYIAAQPEEKGWDAAMRDPAFVDSLHEGLADLAAGRVRPMSRDDEA